MFTWIDELGESHALIRPPEEIKRRLLEMLLHSTATDLRASSGQAVVQQSENGIELMKLVQGFVIEPGASSNRFSNRVSIMIFLIIG